MKTKSNFFAMCLGTMLFTLPDAVNAQLIFTTNNGAITITGYNGSPGIVVIPGTTNGYPVTSMGAFAFGYCTTLTSVTIPDSVTNLANGAFFSCISLTNVVIGKGVTSLGNQPFDRCYKLTTITVNPTNSLYSSTNGVLFNGNKTALVEYPMGRAGTFTVPDSVAFISAFSFDRCTNLASVTIGNSGTTISSIAECAFLGCSGLTNLMIGTNVAGIGFEAFADCTSLTSVTIPDRVSSIEQDAFSGCSKLTAITVDTNNSWYSSTVGVLFDQSQKR